MVQCLKIICAFFYKDSQGEKSMAEDTTVLTPDGIESPDEERDSGKSLIVAKDLLPDRLMLMRFSSGGAP